MQTQLKSGFTLVEAVVVGFLVAILAAGFIAVMKHTYDTGKKIVGESVLQTRLLAIENAMLPAIRNSAVALGVHNGETYSNLKSYNTIVNSQSFALFNDTGLYLGGYAIDASGQLMELSKISLYEPATPFYVGGEIIHVETSSSFVLYPNRKKVGIDLSYTSTVKGAQMLKSFSIDSVRCRN